MNRMVFQIMGAFLLAFAVMVALGGAVTVARYPPHSIRDVIPLALASALLLLLGIGLYRVRKWAALAFSVLTVGLAGWSIGDAIHSVPCREGALVRSARIFWSQQQRYPQVSGRSAKIKIRRHDAYDQEGVSIER
jgi:hypothetical protein